MSVEKIFYAKNDGYLVMDRDKKQGNFIFYYPPSGKVVIFDVWENKKGDIKLAYNKRKNCNANILPSNAEEVLKVMAKLAGVENSPVVEIKEVEKKEGGQVGLLADIKRMGGV